MSWADRWGPQARDPEPVVQPWHQCINGLALIATYGPHRAVFVDDHGHILRVTEPIGEIHQSIEAATARLAKAGALHGKDPAPREGGEPPSQ